MSGTGDVSADFAGEERAFRIRLGEIRAIEAKCGVGIGLVQARLARATVAYASLEGVSAVIAAGDWSADDVRETLYQGLRGKGMPDAMATKLIRQEIDERGMSGLEDSMATALKVLRGSQEAPKEDAAGELPAGPSATTPPSPSTSPISTASDLPSA